MEIFFTSDIHFGHKRLMEIFPDTRGLFPSVEALDRHIISNWNSVISPEDTVYVLGDIGICPTPYLHECLAQLNGNKILIAGNHDVGVVNGVSPYFMNIYFNYHEVWINDQMIVLCHYPIWEWNGMYRGSWHLHGHLHGRLHGIGGRILDVGLDNHNLVPISYDQVKGHMDACASKLRT